MNYPDIQKIISISQQAADCILAIYREPFIAVNYKQDRSLLTRADSESHAIICDSLKKAWPDIPVISEESTEFHDYAARKNWESFFLVDPLDGTKEFVNRHDEFTVNIAFVSGGQPILGVIHVPALNRVYYAEHGQGAYRMSENKHIRLQPNTLHNKEKITVVVSRSHSCQKTENFLEALKKEGRQVTTVSAGSALKFGLVAEGQADMYPRFTPTMEWDTAAGHVLINEVGKKMIMLDDGDVLRYNKENLMNGGFVVR